MLRPAAFRQNEGSDRHVPGPLYLGYLVGYGVYLRIHVHPEAVNLFRTFRGKPRAFGNGQVASRFQELAPFVQPPFKADIVNGPFRPDQVQFFFCKRELVHGTDDAFYPVLQA